MKRILFVLFLVSCTAKDEDYDAIPGEFLPINYITLTNESTNGGSQIAYMLSGYNAENLNFCFCQQGCSREIIVVAALEFNNDTKAFRYKLALGDAFKMDSSSDWCTRYN
jgi:hypothetical protein